MPTATRTRTSSALLGLLLTLGGLLAFAAPASAAAPSAIPIPSNCKAGMFCVWQNAGYTKGFAVVSRSGSLDGLTFDNGVPVGGNISSYVNRRSRDVCLLNADGQLHICDGPGGRRENLALDHWDNSGASPNDATHFANI
jgi:hypothetical protein